MPRSLSEGIYEQLLDYELQERLQANPELRAILRQLEDEAAPHTYAQFVSKLIQQALSQLNAKQRLPLVNRLIELLAAQDGIEYLQKRRLLAEEKSLLTDVARLPATPRLRPVTPLGTSSLLTGQGGDPTLEHELRAEMETADRVDILVSFIKWSGLRLLVPAFQKLGERGVSVRVISTSYMGASDPEALEWLAKQKNIQVRLSYDTDVTRLHAKAYYFWRDSGFSTAYIGSANMSRAAMTQGLEWTLKVTAQDMPHILERFNAEFATYWESKEFESYN